VLNHAPILSDIACDLPRIHIAGLNGILKNTIG